MPTLSLQGSTQESEITPAPPLPTANQQQFHRANKFGSTPLYQTKIDIYQAGLVVDKALSIEEEYRRMKAEHKTLLSFFCCITNSTREMDLEFISCVANDVKVKLALAGMLLNNNSLTYENAQNTAKNVELIIWASYVYIIRKIKSSYNFYENLLGTKSKPAQSILYTLVRDRLKEHQVEIDDLAYLIYLRRYLIESIQTDTKDFLLKEAYLVKLQSQIDTLSETNKDSSSDEEMLDSDDIPLIILQK